MSIVDSIVEDRITDSQYVTYEIYKQQLISGFRKFAQNRLATVGLSIVSAIVLLAIFAPLIAPYDPYQTFTNAQGPAAILQPPSWEHPMGTTNLARDVFSQWVYGSRVALIVGFLSGLSVVLVGSTVGLVAGYYKGTVDLVVMRVVDVLYGIPAVPLVLVVAMFFGGSIWNILIVMVLVLWRTMARVVRSQALSLSSRPFVKAARAAGASDLRIMYIHIAPNLLPLILIEATFVMGAAILIQASLAFLGIGGQMMSWGKMLQLTFSSGAIRTAWWWVLPPGLSITALVVAFFYISRGIEEITNPELNR